MAFITSDPIAPHRHALYAWVPPLATCALPKGVCYLLTYLLQNMGGHGNDQRTASLNAFQPSTCCTHLT